MNVLIWILSSCVLILAVLLIRALFGRKMRPGLRYALWALVLVRLLVPGSFWESPVSVEAPVSRTELGQDLDLLREVDTVTRSPEGQVSGASSRPVPGRGMDRQPVILAQDVTPERFERLRSTLSLRNAAEIVWATGGAAVLIVFLATNVMFYVNLRRRRKRLDGDLPVRVYEVDGLESSCLFLNAVYVNSETAEDPLKLRHVLAHELSHRRHLDGLWALLRCAALTVHWFDPLVWLAASRSRQDSELFADAGALRRLGEEERESYGGTLISLSVHTPRAVSPLCTATTMSGGKKALRKRVELIARRPRATVAVLLAVTLIAGIAVGCTFAGSAYKGASDSAGDGGEVKTDAAGPGEAASPEGGNTGLPQTPNIAAYESEALPGLALLYPADWAELVALSDGIVGDDLMNAGPHVRIDLREDVFGDAPDSNAVSDNAVAFVYWLPAGQSGPEAESGESVTLYTDEDGSELRCWLPMNAKLGFTGDGAGPDAERVYNAYDTVERDILDGKLAVRSADALREISSLTLRELFELYRNGGGFAGELYLTELTGRFLASPAPFLSALAEEPEEDRSFIANTLGAYLGGLYPEEAGACFRDLAGTSLERGEAALLEIIQNACMGMSYPYTGDGWTMEAPRYLGGDPSLPLEVTVTTGDGGCYWYLFSAPDGSSLTVYKDLYSTARERYDFMTSQNGTTGDALSLTVTCTDEDGSTREERYIDCPDGGHWEIAISSPRYVEELRQMSSSFRVTPGTEPVIASDTVLRRLFANARLENMTITRMENGKAMRAVSAAGSPHGEEYLEILRSLRWADDLGSYAEGEEPGWCVILETPDFRIALNDSGWVGVTTSNVSFPAWIVNYEELSHETGLFGWDQLSSWYDEAALPYTAVSDSEAERIRDTVEDYLTRFSTESMLYTDQDLRTNTVLDGRCDTRSLSNGDETSFELPGGAQTVAQMRKNIAFYEDKAAYWKGARQLENIYRKDMRLDYRFDEITANGDTARVQVSEYASFTYQDSTTPSAFEMAYTVDLVKIGDEWWIADIVDIYDWFDARFKNTDFDVQAELDALRAQLEADPADLADLGFEEPYLDRPAGITMELLYEGEDSIIFVGETGVWGYDLREECITFGIDLLKVFNNMVYFQGEGSPYSVYVEASADGKELVLSCAYQGTTDPERERETYYIDVPTLTYRKGIYRILDDPFNFEDAVGTIIPGIYVGQAVYIRGDKTYELFK